MLKNKPDKLTILVTDTGRGSAIAIIRSLGRKGWRVIAADSDPNSLGFRSRYVQETLLYPAPETAPLELVATLLKAVREWNIDLIIPITDGVILPIAEVRDQFEKLGCQLALPDPTALEVTTNKFKTMELAERLGVPTPQTHLVYTAQEACQKAGSLGWPVVLKPQVSRLYRDHSAVKAFTVCYAENLSHLAEQMKRFEGYCPVLLQEYYAGIGHGVELLLYQGRTLAGFQHRRLREIPINGGASAFRESAPLDPVLYDYSLRLLKALNWTGLAMVEFKLGQDGPKLMEINGRVWGSLPLAVASGMDFPARLVQLYLYGPPPADEAPALNYTVGLRARNLQLEMLWIAKVLRGQRRYPFLTMPSRRQGLKALLELLHPAYKFDILSWEDLRPGLAEIPTIARKFSRKLQEET